MPKQEPAAAPPAEQIDQAPAAPTVFPVTLDEYCSRVSHTDRRVELIGAFHSSELRAGRVKDLSSAFDVRFEDFANQPV